MVALIVGQWYFCFSCGYHTTKETEIVAGFVHVDNEEEISSVNKSGESGTTEQKMQETEGCLDV